MADPQLDGVATSLIACRILVDVFDADNEADFEARVLPRFPEGTIARWSGIGLLRPAIAVVLEPDGTLWAAAAGLEDYARLFASFMLSDPVATVPGDYLVHPIAWDTAQGLQGLAEPFLDAGQVSRLNLIGHSMGGAAVVTNAALWKLSGKLPAATQLITTGAPKPGDQRLKDAVADVPIIRWQGAYDPVPLIPPSVGIFTQISFAFPISTGIGAAFGYKQIGGGRRLNDWPTPWSPRDFDLGLSTSSRSIRGWCSTRGNGAGNIRS